MKQEKISFSFTFKKEGKCDERIEQREEEKKIENITSFL
jgi:hypothetical protein